MPRRLPHDPPASARRPLAANVWIAGVISLFTDVSSEMIVPVLPLFLNSLGVPKSLLGLIEGLAEATASVVKAFSGWLSDRMGRRKPLMLAGYGLSNVLKPLFALVSTWPGALLLRVLDRFGKGVRGAPRDALLADSTTPEQRGRAFGLHRAMDTLGAAIGPLLAYAILRLGKGENYRGVFLATAIPGLLGILAVLMLRERSRGQASSSGAVVRGFTLRTRHLAPELRWFILVGAVFALGNSADAFLVLRAQDLGLATALVPVAYFCFNLTYALLGYPLGALSDRIGRRPLLIGGYLIFALIYAGFALASHSWQVWPLFLAYGLYYAATEGVQKAYITDLARPEERGAAVGAFNAYVGLATLPASLAAGWLWDHLGAAAAFWLGSGMAVAAALLLTRWSAPGTALPHDIQNGGRA